MIDTKDIKNSTLKYCARTLRGERINFHAPYCKIFYNTRIVLIILIIGTIFNTFIKIRGWDTFNFTVSTLHTLFGVSYISFILSRVLLAWCYKKGYLGKQKRQSFDRVLLAVHMYNRSEYHEKVKLLNVKHVMHPDFKILLNQITIKVNEETITLWHDALPFKRGETYMISYSMGYTNYFLAENT